MELARHVDDLLTDEERARAIADRARADVQPYTWDERARSILEFLRASN